MTRYLAVEVATRSRAWVWIVGVGLAVVFALSLAIVRAVIRSLPEEVGTPVRNTLRENTAPLTVGAILLIGSLVFALWSAGLPSIGRLEQTAGGVVEQSPTAADQFAGDDVGGDAASTDVTASASATGQAPAGSRPSSRAPGAGFSVGAPVVASHRDANLYSGAANTTGINASTVKVCGHAPLSLGAALNTKPEDLLVFWRYLNAKGGIHGRTFDVTLEDDQYTAEGGVPAAQACAERNPFFIFGALGSDVIPPVRVWAEQNKQLYLYGFTLKKGSESFKYSYSAVISQEDLSLVIADQAVRRFPGKNVGIVWRNSSNFQPGRDAYKRWVSSHGMKVVADLPVQKSQGSYTQEIIALQQAGAEVVFILDDAVSQLNVVKQGKTQQYNPHWQVFTFNVQTQTLGNDALDPPLIGANLAPAYECRTYTGPYASYAAEIKEFEAAYATYSPNTDLCGIAGDIAWAGWIGFKSMAALFESCGRDCTRNRWAGLMDSGYHATIGAACELDFRGNGHHGGLRADLMEAYRTPSGRAAFRNSERCVRAPAG